MSEDRRTAQPGASDTPEKGQAHHVKVSDKRRSAAPAPPPGPSAESGAKGGEQKEASDEAASLLEALKRERAEFDNYRKRMMREQTEIARHSTAGLVKKLLPVLDNFERAAAHDSDSTSLELLRKDLMSVLAAEGLEEIPAAGEPFDPHVHEAVESREQEDVEVPTCITVYRTGYRLGGKVLRPAMVGVARPVERTEDETGDAASG